MKNEDSTHANLTGKLIGTNAVANSSFFILHSSFFIFHFSSLPLQPAEQEADKHQPVLRRVVNTATAAAGHQQQGNQGQDNTDVQAPGAYEPPATFMYQWAKCKYDCAEYGNSDKNFFHVI